ncbi:MAG: hypothetical protein ABSA16_16545 [Thermoguttaceae bacterium]|jgi:hypothetical protein
MRDERKYSAYPSDLDVLQSFIQLQDYLIECGYEEDLECCDKISYDLRLNEFRSLHAENYSEFLRVLEQYPHAGSIGLHTHWKRGNDDTFMCDISLRPSEIEISVKSEDLNTIAAIHDKAKEFFRAYNPPQNKSS